MCDRDNKNFMKLTASRRGTTRSTTVDQRRSSNDDDRRQGPDDDQEPFVSRDTTADMSPPPRHLVTKLMEQNARLKNLARRLIAERGLTVSQYLVRLTAYFIGLCISGPYFILFLFSIPYISRDTVVRNLVTSVLGADLKFTGAAG